MEKKFTSDAQTFFLALADETRLRLLNLMRDREVNVNAFVRILNASQPKVSRHLAFLRKAGIVDVRRDGKWIYYKITLSGDEFFRSILKDTLRWLESSEPFERENKEYLDLYAANDDNGANKTFPSSDIFVERDMNKHKRQELAVFLL